MFRPFALKADSRSPAPRGAALAAAAATSLIAALLPATAALADPIPPTLPSPAAEATATATQSPQGSQDQPSPQAASGTTQATQAAPGTTQTILPQGGTITPMAAETEPNDNFYQATPMTLGTPYDGQIGPSDGTDFYRFTTTQDGNLRLQFSFPTPGNAARSWRLDVYDNQGGHTRLRLEDRPAGQEDPTGAAIANQYFPLTAGTYYITVRQNQSGTAPATVWTYHLSLSLTPEAVEHEPNGTKATATPLAFGTTLAGSVLGTSNTQYGQDDILEDQDYYSFTVPSPGGLVRLAFTFPQVSGPTEMYKWTISSDTMAGLLRLPTLTQADWNGAWATDYDIYLQPGTYYLHNTDSWARTPTAAAWGLRYSLRLTFSAKTPIEAEPNNTAATATQLTALQTINASVIPSADPASVADYDYYRFTQPATGEAAIIFKHTPLAPANHLFAYFVVSDASGTQVPGSYQAVRAGTAEVELRLPNLPAGTYTILVLASPAWAGTSVTCPDELGWSYQLTVGTAVTVTLQPLAANPLYGQLLVPSYTVSPSSAKTTLAWYVAGRTTPVANALTYRPTMDDRGKTLSFCVKATATGYLPTERCISTTVQYTPTYPRLTLSPDLTGDGYGDLLGLHLNGELHEFPGTASGAVGGKTVLATGLGTSWISGPGDWNGDNLADVVTVDSAGRMWLRAGNGQGRIAATQVQIGHGWSAYRIIPAGDLNQDGANDMLAIDTAGKLWLYAGNGRGAFLPGRTEVGHGWTNLQLLAAGDLDGDGKGDILGISQAGLLFAYSGRGNGTFAAAKQVGHGWTGLTLAAGADINRDGLADIVGRNDSTGRLYFYAGKGGGQFKAAVALGTGW
ncbi:MAG: FG-GAP-like repeat-containing protein [Bifidobacteriaceae bacterium]|jgi:hypothetical protein|nr:FG-GAP-like repeat-containing protein [Bifidobacteriaceae bacterium]